jgi:hypothetical protein
MAEFPAMGLELGVMWFLAVAVTAEWTLTVVVVRCCSCWRLSGLKEWAG